MGKSRLAEEFAQASGCPYVYYTAVQQEGEAELALAAEGASARRPLILAIDEFPYLAQKQPAIESILQKVWDRNWQSSPIVVLLIGSDEAMMRALTEQGRPLYDRLREMVVRPLSPAAVGDLLQLAPADAYLAEALTDPTSFLVVSGERTLSAEFPAPAPRAVLAAIGAGARAHSALLGHTGLSATTVNETLESLRRRDVVRRLTPYSTKAAPKTALWEVTDPYLRFWLGFVDGRIDLIERGRGSLLLERFERSWPAYRGRAIEHLVRDAVERLVPDAERFGDARHVGAYWNRTGAVEVDLVGGDRQPVAGSVGFVGSVKWRSGRPFGRADGLALAAQRSEVPGASAQTPLVGVSAQGFDDDAPLDVRLAPEDLIAA